METKDFMTKPVKGLFFHYLIPSIMGTMVTSIYVLADTIIIGKGLGSVAMAALNIALPFIMCSLDWDFYLVWAALY